MHPVRGDEAAEVNVPSPLPNKIATLSALALATAKSSFPSPLKSPVTTDMGVGPVAMGEPLAFEKATVGAEAVTGNGSMFEIKAEPGLNTVTHAVPGEAMLAAGTVAFSSSLLT